ncbi:MAG: WecB/TagA/CpsF family glycosyltransferase [Sporolactobacillus sp.]
MNNKKWLGNLAINTYTCHEQPLQELTKRLQTHCRTTLFFLNDHAFNLAQDDAAYRRILNAADLLLNDGVGIKIGARLFGIRLEENLNGTDFIPLFLRLCLAQGRRVYLLGAKADAVAAAARRLSNQFAPELIAGFHHGYFRDVKEMVAEINASGADVLIVGMGMPLQEKFIAAQHETLKPAVCIAAGGFIDFASGLKRRAPKIMRQLNLEWLFRMMLEPRRMWRRNVIGHVRFFTTLFTLKRRR